MKLEDQVTSLELSKKIRSLGFKKESHFYWNYHGNITVNNPYNSYLNAFTLQELGTFLPPMTTSGKTYQQGKIHDHDKDYNCYCPLYDHNEFGKSEIICRLKMLVWLIENNLITS